MKKKYAGFVMNELRRLKQLEEENRKLKQNEYRPDSSLNYKKPDAFAKSRIVDTAKNHVAGTVFGVRSNERSSAS